MTNTPLNPDALEAAAKATYDFRNEDYDEQYHDLTYGDKEYEWLSPARVAVSAYLAAAQPDTLAATLESFINQRPEFITALKNTRGTDDQSDYHRWQGHAESRRHLATLLGWTVPQEPGETTHPEVKL